MVVAGLRGQGAQQSRWAFFVQTLRGKAFQADCFVARLAKGMAIGTSPCFAHSILESRCRSPVEFFNSLLVVRFVAHFVFSNPFFSVSLCCDKWLSQNVSQPIALPV